jgi:hypothetical protein
MKSLLIAVALNYVGLPALPLTLEQQLGIDYIGKTPNEIVAMQFAALALDAKPEQVATSKALDAFIDPTATWHLEAAAATAAASQAYREAFWARIPLPQPRPQDAYAMQPVDADPVNATPVAPGAIQRAGEQLNR